jgi:hypothetical protein
LDKNINVSEKQISCAFAARQKAEGLIPLVKASLMETIKVFLNSFFICTQFLHIP